MKQGNIIDLKKAVNINDVKSGFNLKEVLEDIAHYLPVQGPLKDFIHHNTLHAFQDWPFEAAVREAEKLYGARRNLSMQAYRAMIREGKIKLSSIKEVLYSRVADATTQNKYLKAIENSFLVDLETSPLSPLLRWQWTRLLGDDLNTYVDPLLFRLISQFLDQGIAIWSMPGSDHLSFYHCVRKLCLEAGPAVPLLTRPIAKSLLTETPEQAVRKALSFLITKSELWESYLWETHFEHPGWSGLVSVLEKNPELLIKRKNISLVEFSAIKLILEVSALEKYLGSNFRPISANNSPLRFPLAKISADREINLTDVLQEALEETYYKKVSQSLLKHPIAKKIIKPSVQVLCCIDDREAALRRHLEAIDSTIDTYGTAGFFGIDAMVLKDGDLYPIKSCPAPVKPQHLIIEKAREDKSREHRRRSFKLMSEIHGASSKTLLSGFMKMPILGLTASLRLVFDVLSPWAHARAYGLDKAPIPGAIHLHRSKDSPDSRYQLGFTVEEMAGRVSGVLKSIGLTSNFAPIVMVVAHGSSSANNPYFAAYDCGACSGRPGAPNARAFASMANQDDVRALLKTNFNIDIPNSTKFIGAIHDTCRDTVECFDADLLSETHAKAFQEFRQKLEAALNKNAIERCQNFELISSHISEKGARKVLKERALSIFEPRPELNHATNASCVVGTGELTRGLNLDRRAFLQSYEPSSDPNGEILAGILSAVVPVCGGINLEYYFSRIDPNKYGAGSKLPHNVVGLLGVVNGVEGDVLTGLPTQMTEVHDPIRLLLVIEQKPDVVQEVLKKLPNVNQWIRNEWMHLMVLDSSNETKKMYRYQNGRFSEMAHGVAQ